MTDIHRCVCCAVLRPGGEPRIYDRPQVCDGCRARLRCLLAEVADYWTLLADPPPVVDVDHDPVSARLPVSPIAGASTADRVSGSPADRLPVDMTVLDLLLPAGTGTAHGDCYGDQDGNASVAAVLDSWARDWQQRRWQWETLPAATVPALVGWLTHRLDWACNDHPAVDDFADELRGLASVARRAAGLTYPPVETFRYRGVPCRSCDQRALFRWGAEHGRRSDYIECGSCNALLSDSEYDRWVSLISAPEHQPWVRDRALADLSQRLSTVLGDNGTADELLTRVDTTILRDALRRVERDHADVETTLLPLLAEIAEREETVRKTLYDRWPAELVDAVSNKLRRWKHTTGANRGVGLSPEDMAAITDLVLSALTDAGALDPTC